MLSAARGIQLSALLVQKLPPGSETLLCKGFVVKVQNISKTAVTRLEKHSETQLWEARELSL